MTDPIPFLEYMTSAFGDVEGRITPARGISVAPGGLPFPAWVAGEVVRSEYNQVLGNTVTVRAPDGWFVNVSHLAERNVEPGDQVKVGDQLGVIGATGTGCVGRCAFISVTDQPLARGYAIDPVAYSRGEVGAL